MKKSNKPPIKKQPPIQSEWTFGEVKIPVEIHREARKNVRVSFGKDKLILRSSLYITPQEEEKAFKNLHATIEKRVIEKPELLTRFAQKSYKNGDMVVVGRKKYHLLIEKEARKSHTARRRPNSVLEFILAADDTEGGQQKAISTLLSRLVAQDYNFEFVQRVRELNQVFFKKDVKSVSFKYNHTNWGSCSSTGNLNFSTRLFFAPDDVQDYVIIHELAHLIELNHSDRFWKLVADAMPDFQEKEKWLRLNGEKCRF